MDIEKNVNLALLFRNHDAKLGVDNVNPKEYFFDQKIARVESGASSFLIDKKYALRLDELI